MKVRGTPGSGKTVLTRLLAAHIRQQDPTVDKVLPIFSWPPIAGRGDYISILKEKGWAERKKAVFIFDKGQLTYDDEGLWNDLICWNGGRNRFASIQQCFSIYCIPRVATEPLVSPLQALANHASLQKYNSGIVYSNYTRVRIESEEPGCTSHWTLAYGNCVTPFRRRHYPITTF